MVSEKVYLIPFGSGKTAFFAEAEPDDNGLVRGSVALAFDDTGKVVTDSETCCVPASELVEVVDGIVWNY